MTSASDLDSKIADLVDSAERILNRASRVSAGNTGIENLSRLATAHTELARLLFDISQASKKTGL